MKANDIMSKKPEFLPPTATIKEAAKLMRDQDYGFIPVGENDRLIGTVTDRDITIRAVAEGKDPNTVTLKEVMTEELCYCYDTDTTETIAQLMEESQVRRLVVLNADKRMVGIISLGDLATKCKNAKLSSEVTDAVSQP